MLDIHDDLVGVFSAELVRPRKPGRLTEELRDGGVADCAELDDATELSLCAVCGISLGFVG
jgi:hypothetical protein